MRLLLITLLLLTLSGLVPGSSAQDACTPRTDWDTYTIVAGDTLFDIAQRFGTTVADLAAANCLEDTNLIFEGQSLYVPPPGGEDTRGVIAPDTEPQSIVGAYHMMATGAGGEIQMRLSLLFDGSLRFETHFIASEETIVEDGRWLAQANRLDIYLTGQIEPEQVAYDEPELLVFEFQDGYPVNTQYNTRRYGTDGLALTLGSGDFNPMVGLAQERLAALAYTGLEINAVSPSLFDEATREAVVAFQRAQQIVPDGVIDRQTWEALADPAPPVELPPEPTPAPPQQILGVPNLDNLPTTTDGGSPILYFTFDDGPSIYTQQFLDVLAANNAQATFFVLVQNAQAQPDLIRAQAAGGHYVANHTFDHHTLDGISRSAFIDEVRNTEQILLGVAQDLFVLDGRVRFLRPPYGATDANTRGLAAELGYAVVLWNVDTQDWRRPGTDVIANHIMTHAFPGAVILMHDGGGDRSQSVAALQTVLPQLAAQGYVFRNIFVE